MRPRPPTQDERDEPAQDQQDQQRSLDQVRYLALVRLGVLGDVAGGRPGMPSAENRSAIPRIDSAK